MWWITFLLSVVFLGCSLHVFPLLAMVFYKRQHRYSETLNTIQQVDVLIPCHNEEGRLHLTLKSLQKSIQKAQSLFPRVRFNILIGLDDCSDATLQDSHGFKAKVLVFQYRSKWKVLRSLVEQSSADWVAFVDAGTLWDDRLLRNCLPYFAHPENICVAPSYTVLTKNWLGRIFWSLEKNLKSIENASGGPISVHGATVFYQRKKLIETLDLLEGRDWLNDDVAIPLALRIANPQERILYASNTIGGFAVYDAAPRPKAFEKAARDRVAQGNIQWIEHLLPVARVWNQRVLFFALRRIFRLVWSIAPLLMMLSVLFYIAELSLPREKIYIHITIFTLITLLFFHLLQRPSFASSLRAAACLLGLKRRSGEDLKWN